MGFGRRCGRWGTVSLERFGSVRLARIDAHVLSLPFATVGRAGYGGTLDGMWPYSYNECDVGTLRNQSKDGAFGRKSIPTISR